MRLNWEEETRQVEERRLGALLQASSVPAPVTHNTIPPWNDTRCTDLDWTKFGSAILHELHRSTYKSNNN